MSETVAVGAQREGTQDRIPPAASRHPPFRQGGQEEEGRVAVGAQREVDLRRVVGDGYGEFWRCKKRYRVLKGGKASKKSTTTALNFIVRLMREPLANLLVIRAVMDTHRTSTFAQLRWAIERLGVGALWRCTTSPLEMTFLPTGQKILFRGFDNVYKIASTTVTHGYLCWVWVEEAFEIESEDEFDTFDLSVPRGVVPPPLYKQTTLTFNPWSDRHWLKRRFFDDTPPNTATFTTTYRCNEFLDDADRAVFERMRQYHPRRYAVAGEGEWGVDEGLIFENWEVAEFDLPSQDDWRWKRVYGLDYGYAHDPTAFVAAAVDPLSRRILVFDEFKETGLLGDAIAEKLTRGGYAGERIRADSAEPRTTDDLRRRGIYRIFPAEKGAGSVLYGIDRLQEYHITVHPRCRELAAELATYAWERDTGGVRSRPRGGNDHLIDALRYAMDDVTYFRPAPPERPRRSEQTVRAEDLRGGWG